MSEDVKSFIRANWGKCVKHNQKSDGTFIGMPYPYTVPAVGCFDEMYYWDTYFTNIGLMICGNYELAKNNVDNMFYLIDKYGFMPNGNRTYYLKNSQPPFLSCMVRDLYNHYKDRVWLSAAYDILEREYVFWQTKRMSKIGLNHYDWNFAAEEEGLSKSFAQRVGIAPNIENYKLARHTVASCESGWDMNPRWGYECYNFAPPDLNSLMFMFERNMEFFGSELNKSGHDKWNKRAERRRRLMLDKMDDGSGVLLDYNFETGELSRVFSAASFFPMFAGLADKRGAEALVKQLYRLEADYGILTCEKNNTEGTYQWDYPNGWACLQYVVAAGLDRYGYKDDAKRIAEKYIKLADKVFAETNNLWEKYNVADGTLDVAGEYEQPAMMGWSAGVYLAADEYINKL